jgi:hypothetical protein
LRSADLRDLGAHRDERDLARLGLGEPERGLDRELVAGVERALDALAHEQEILAEGRRALRFGHVLDQDHDLHG